MFRRFFCFPGVLAMLAVVSVAEAQSVTNKFEGEIRKFEEVDSRTPPPAHAVLFTGSSSIRLWTNLVSDFGNLKVLNRGFGGSQMSDLVFFFDRVVRPYRPSVIVVYEGDNDLAGGKSADQVYADFEVFLKRVRQELPGTSVALLAVKSSPSRIKLMDSQRDLNRRLETLAGNSPGLLYIDTFHPLLDSRANPRPEYYRDDRLHLNSAGYALWRKVIEAALQKIPAARAPQS